MYKFFLIIHFRIYSISKFTRYSNSAEGDVCYTCVLVRNDVRLQLIDKCTHLSAIEYIQALPVIWMLAIVTACIVVVNS